MWGILSHPESLCVYYKLYGTNPSLKAKLFVPFFTEMKTAYYEIGLLITYIVCVMVHFYNIHLTNFVSCCHLKLLKKLPNFDKFQNTTT